MEYPAKRRQNANRVAKRGTETVFVPVHLKVADTITVVVTAAADTVTVVDTGMAVDMGTAARKPFVSGLNID